MSTKGGNRSKQKRSLQTTLGKAPQNTNTEPIDLSHLRKPIDTSIFGLSQALSLFNTGTDEVRRYITYECELMFECRVCRTVFRSVANLVLHKRNYCQELYNPINADNKTNFENNDLTIVNKNTSSSNSDGKESETEALSKGESVRNLSAVLKRLSDKQECQKYAESVLNQELTERSYMEENKEDVLLKTVCLEGIENNYEGVFQTMNYEQVGDDLMKSEVMEIHSILNTNEAILDADGKVFTFKREINDTSGQNLICTICNLKFATKKTLTHHIKYKHNDTRIVYICPECKDNFANAWCVFRHLYKVHRKTSAQIRRMRDQIHSSAIIKSQEPLKKKGFVMVETSNNYEFNSHPDDAQSCEGCGKRFDRKAALHSHVQMCLKQLALNAAKESQKNIQEEKLNKQKAMGPKGSSKRKPNIAHRILRRRSSLNILSEHEERLGTNEEIKDNKKRRNSEMEIINVNDQVTPDDSNSVREGGCRKRLIEEIILGNKSIGSTNNSQDSPPCKKYIGFVSDREEMLGFMKESDMALQDNATNILSKENHSDNRIKERLSPTLIETEQSNTDCAFVESKKAMRDNAVKDEVKVEETVIHPEFEQNGKKFTAPNTDEIDVSIKSDELLDEFPKVTTPRQYASRKGNNSMKTNQSLTSIPDELAKVRTADDDINATNNNINTAEIDLPYDIQNNTDVSLDYDISQTKPVYVISDSDSSSSSDDGSNNYNGRGCNQPITSIQSMQEGAETLVNNRNDVIPHIEQNHTKNRCRKRRRSIELEYNEEPTCLSSDSCSNSRSSSDVNQVNVSKQSIEELTEKFVNNQEDVIDNIEENHTENYDIKCKTSTELEQNKEPECLLPDDCSDTSSISFDFNSATVSIEPMEELMDTLVNEQDVIDNGGQNHFELYSTKCANSTESEKDKELQCLLCDERSDDSCTSFYSDRAVVSIQLTDEKPETLVNNQLDVIDDIEQNPTENRGVKRKNSMELRDEHSSESSTSFNSDQTVVLFPTEEVTETLVIDQEDVIDNIEQSHHYIKDTNLTDLQINTEEEYLFHDKCQSYVDWSTFSCRSCSISFSAEIELLEHMALHFNWFRYQCSKCNFMSYDENVCKQHTCIDNGNIETNENNIVPVPLSKIIHTATSFTNITNDSIQIASSIDEKQNKQAPAVTCGADKVNTQDPLLRKMIMEVIFGSQEAAAKPPTSAVNARPIRNRVSIRSVQKDFEFDMKQINLMRRKACNEPKVKPIKIVKKSDLNFRVVNTSTEDLSKKKRSY